MATKTWTAAVDHDFATAGNWSPSGVPTSSDTAVITGTDPPTNCSTTVTCSFDSTGCTVAVDAGIGWTESVVIPSGGTLKYGNASADPDTFNGNASVAASCDFYGQSGYASPDYPVNNPYFHDSSNMPNGGATTGTLTWDSDSTNPFGLQ